MLPPFVSGMAAAGGAAIYLLFAYFQFRTSGTWYPVLLPVFIQPAFAWDGVIRMDSK